MKFILNEQFVRFVIVGVINTLNYYVLYLLFYHLAGLNYMSAHIIAFLISMIGSFYLNSYFTYKVKPTFKKFLQFPLTYVVNITVTTLAIWVFVDVLGWSESLSPLLATVLAIPFTFVVSKFILTGNNQVKREE
jgi:putative flippase GtrA